MKRVRNALRYILLIVGILITLFAILSGAKIYGGGIGGIGLIIFGFCMMYFFNFSLIPALIGLLIVASGFVFVLSK